MLPVWRKNNNMTLSIKQLQPNCVCMPQFAAKAYLLPTCPSFLGAVICCTWQTWCHRLIWSVQFLPCSLLSPSPQCLCVCVSQPHLTSQSNSRCSCPSIHSSMSSLLCRSLRSYFTVSLPSLRCAEFSVLSTVWNITLDWVLGSDAIVATALGEPWVSSPPTHTKPHRLWHVCFIIPCSISDFPVGCSSHMYLPLSCWVFVLSLSITLALCLSSLSCSLSLTPPLATPTGSTIRRMIMRYASVCKCLQALLLVCMCVRLLCAPVDIAGERA